MNNSPETTAPRCGVLAPAFTLPDVMRSSDAEPVRLRTWRQRRPVLLALLPQATGVYSVAWLRALADRSDDLDYARAAVVAIVGGDHEAAQALWRQADVSFPILVDSDGATLAAYLGANVTQPALAVINRYNVLLALLPATGAQSAPELDTALREFAFAEQEDCACGLPSWPVDA